MSPMWIEVCYPPPLPSLEEKKVNKLKRAKKQKSCIPFIKIAKYQPEGCVSASKSWLNTLLEITTS